MSQEKNVVPLLDHIQKYGTLLGVICIAYLQTLFPSKKNFEDLYAKFIEIDKKITELSFIQTTLNQQQVKIADIEIRLRQLELDIVKVRAEFNYKK